MEKHIVEQLDKLIEREKELTEKFRAARAVLEGLVQPITNHVTHCVNFWKTNFDAADKIAVVDQNGLCLEIKRPKREVAKVETYLPFGIDYTIIPIVILGEKEAGNGT